MNIDLSAESGALKAHNQGIADLARDILIEVEKLPFDGGWHEVQVAKHSEDEISYHVLLLHESGLIEAEDLSSMDGICWMPKRLTWDGHEFLEASRDDTMWAKAKGKVMSTTGTLTLDALKITLGALIKQALTGGM